VVQKLTEKNGHRTIVTKKIWTFGPPVFFFVCHPEVLNFKSETFYLSTLHPYRHQIKLLTKGQSFDLARQRQTLVEQPEVWLICGIFEFAQPLPYLLYVHIYLAHFVPSDSHHAHATTKLVHFLTRAAKQELIAHDSGLLEVVNFEGRGFVRLVVNGDDKNIYLG
jgi:hypothetical protein